MKRIGGLIAVFIIMLGFIGVASDVYGFAYRMPTQSTIGLAKGNAVITEMDEPSSVYYNPAATAFSSGIQTSFGSLLITSQSKHEFEVMGVDEHSRRKNYYIPNAYTTVNLKELNLEPVTIGFGAASPFGLGMVWKQNSPIAPVVEKAELKVADYLITGAYKVNDKLSLGAGIDIAYSDAELQRRVDFGALAGLPRALDGIAEFKGSDTSVGFNSSLLFLPAENHSLAFTFRSQQLSRLEGKVKVRRIPPFLGLPANLEGDAEARIKYPMLLEAGYGYQLGKLKLEFALDWARWESVKELVIRSTSNPLISDLKYAADFNNVFTYNAGATYELFPWLDVYLGFIWTETPMPEHTFNAIIPDSDRFGLSCGLGGKWKNMQVDTGFQWVHFEGRNISNSVGAPFTTVNGNYETEAFLVGVNVTFRF